MRKRTSLKTLILIVIASLALLTGCPKLGLGPTHHPGAVSSFDSVAADQLYTAQNVLEGLNAHAADYPKAIPALQVATRDFNTAQNTYFLWRCAVGAATSIGSSNVACPAGNKTTQANTQAALDASTQSLATAQKAANGK